MSAAASSNNLLVPSASSLSSETREYDLSALCDAFLTACRESNTEEIQTSLAELRKAILFQGVEDDAKDFDPAVCTLRGKIWKAMLGLGPVDANFYMSLIDKGTSIKYDKIRGDSFRTFPDDKIFTDRVPEPRLIRVLNSFTHVYAGKDSPFSYRQGMNAICAPLLWCMPEVDAYYAFSKLITERFPLYWTNDVVGAEAGCKLVDQCLQLLDPELHQHLKENGELVAYVYAFSCVSSLSASVRPFEELIFLWDFLLAFGPHLNVVCVAAQVILMRDQLLKTSTPKNLLDYRKWPPLRARVIVHVTMSLLPRIPADLFDRICRHATDPAVCAEIVGRPVKYTPFKAQA